MFRCHHFTVRISPHLRLSFAYARAHALHYTVSVPVLLVSAIVTGIVNGTSTNCTFFVHVLVYYIVHSAFASNCVCVCADVSPMPVHMSRAF